LDAVSIEEVHLGLMAGFTASEILLTPNGMARAS
jgi:diaminopimelate decarboxylase